MSAKKSSSKSIRDSSPVDSTHHRPIAFVWVVAIAGSLSTWFWYRPIPKHALEVANRSVWSQTTDNAPSPQSKWHDSGLIQPSLSNPEPRMYGARLSSTGRADDEARPGPDPSLTGSGDLALAPFQDRIRPLNEWVAGEPLPMVPVESSTHAAREPLPSPTLWTNAPKAPSATKLELDPPPNAPSQSTASLASDAASPFRVPNVNRPTKSVEEPSLITNIWPDQGFDPSQPRPTSAVASHGSGNMNHLGNATPGFPAQGPESVMALSSNRIQTLDRESELPRNTPMQPVLSNVPAQQPKTAQQPPSLIRQPRPRDGNR